METSCTTQWDFSAGKTGVATGGSPAPDFSLYAKWTPITYTIDFATGNIVESGGGVIQGATGTMSSITAIQYDNPVTLPPNTFDRTGFIFAGWSTTPGGALDYTDGATVSNLTTVGGTVTLYARWNSQYTLDATGPGGGKIFYIDLSGFTNTYTNEICYFLEFAPTSIGGNVTWASAGYDNVSILGTGLAIGNGRKNTDLILAIDTTAPAALACNTYSNNGKTDWFLPNRYELNKLYEAKGFVTGVPTTGYYWTSTQTSSTHAYYQAFSTGFEAGDLKGATSNTARPIRMF